LKDSPLNPSGRNQSRKHRHAREEQQGDTLRDLATVPETGPELDTGLRRRPIEEFFLKGPLPLRELVPALKMPGKTGALWLLIAHRITIARNVWVTLPDYALREWGISEDAKTDA
jgi:hypothetical protein